MSVRRLLQLLTWAVLLGAAAVSAINIETARIARGVMRSYNITSDAGTVCSSRNPVPCIATVTYTVKKRAASTSFTFQPSVRLPQVNATLPVVVGNIQVDPASVSLRISPALARAPSKVLGSAPRGRVVAANSNGGPQFVWPWRSDTLVQRISLTVRNPSRNQPLHLTDIAQQGINFTGAFFDNIPNTENQQHTNSALVYVNFVGSPKPSTWNTVTYTDHVSG